MIEKLSDEERHLVDYGQWSAYLLEDQSRPFSSYLWLNGKNPDKTSMFGLTSEQQCEMFYFGRAVEATIDCLAHPDLMNFKALNNRTPRFHAKIIPRYEGVRTLYGIEFRDDYKITLDGPPIKPFKASKKTILQMRDDFKARFSFE